MINKNVVVGMLNKLPSVIDEGVKGPGTARGLMVIVGAIILGLLHPEVAKEYAELIAVALVYGATDIFRRK